MPALGDYDRKCRAAAVAELAYALDLGSSGLTPMEVRVLSAAIPKTHPALSRIAILSVAGMGT